MIFFSPFTPKKIEHRHIIKLNISKWKINLFYNTINDNQTSTEEENLCELYPLLSRGHKFTKLN